MGQGRRPAIIIFMSISKVKLEPALAKSFREFINAVKSAEMLAARKKAFSLFTETGFPSTKQEQWRYTNTAPIASIDWSIGDFHHAAASHRSVPINLIEKFRFERNGFTALNLAFADFQFIRIPAGQKADEPLQIEFGAEENTLSAPHLIIVLEPGSKATLVESHRSASAGFVNSVVRIIIGENASLTHYRLQNDTPQAFNYGLTEVEIARGGIYDATNINIGAALSRHDIDVVFSSPGAEARVDGLYLLAGRQHHDTHSMIDHRFGHCLSRQTYKGILTDESRGVFNGIVYVREGASGTDAQQSNKNLLLSNNARVDTKPQLEIFNDDVKCSHGATVGQLEEEEIFYLRTRGLNDALARNLLTYGFAEEIIEKIGIETIRAELDAALLNRLKTEI